MKREEMQNRGLKLVHVVGEQTAIRQTAMRPPRTFASSLSFVTGSGAGEGLSLGQKSQCKKMLVSFLSP